MVETASGSGPSPALGNLQCSLPPGQLSLQCPACAISMSVEPPLQVRHGKPSSLAYLQRPPNPTSKQACGACMFPAACMQSDAPGLPYGLRPAS